MSRKNGSTVLEHILTEVEQRHSTRKELLKKIQDKLGRTVVSFFTSFDFPVMIEDNDADMLEQVLQATEIKNGLAMIISSAGGLGLTAERIITICRKYSDTGEYWAIVPSKAKSAATLICFGASKIIMSDTSELGPVDPQITLKDESGNFIRYSLYNIVKSYEELFEQTVNLKVGRLEPFLQQLDRYFYKDIVEYKAAIALSEDISLKAIKSGMMSNKSEKTIKNKIKIFLSPKETKTHGRPIYAEEAQKCGLNIEKKGVREEIWSMIHELYVRNNFFVSHRVAKSIETYRQTVTAKFK